LLDLRVTRIIKFEITNNKKLMGKDKTGSSSARKRENGTDQRDFVLAEGGQYTLKTVDCTVS